MSRLPAWMPGSRVILGRQVYLLASGQMGRSFNQPSWAIMAIYFYFLHNFIYWFAESLLLRGQQSLLAATGGYSPGTVLGLLNVVASLAVAHGLSCPTACGIFPDQGSHPCPPYWQADSLSLSHQGSPTAIC